MDNTSKNILIIFLFALIFYLLSILSTILIPLVFAILIATLFLPVINFLKKIKIPNFLTLPIVTVISLVVLAAIITIIIQTVNDISSEQDFLLSRLDEKFRALISWLNYELGLRLSVRTIYKQFGTLPSNQWLTNFAGNIASILGSFTGSFVMFALYYVVILTGMSGYKKYIQYVGGDNSAYFEQTYATIQKSIINYMTIKTLLNISIAIIVTIICTIFGIKFPFFWGFLAFLFHYIPSVGPIISLVPTVLMAIIQFESIESILLFTGTLGAIQFSIGNFIEPMIMGNRLRINTVSVIFGLVFWGYIWGIPGMVLSVPFLVILKVIFEHIPSMNMVARLMSYSEK